MLSCHRLVTQRTVRCQPVQPSKKQRASAGLCLITQIGCEYERKKKKKKKAKKKTAEKILLQLVVEVEVERGVIASARSEPVRPGQNANYYFAARSGCIICRGPVTRWMLAVQEVIRGRGTSRAIERFYCLILHP